MPAASPTTKARRENERKIIEEGTALWKAKRILELLETEQNKKQVRLGIQISQILDDFYAN